MLLRPLKWAWSLAVTLCVLYVVFYVPIGQRTLFQHLRRVAGTPEARELGREVSGAGHRALVRAQDEVRSGLPNVRARVDAGSRGRVSHDASAAEAAAIHLRSGW